MFLTNYSRQGKKLILWILFQVVFTLLYKFFFENDLMLYLGLLSGLGIILFASSIRCRSCGKLQVFTGLSFFDIRIPKKKCHYCKLPLEEKNDSE